MSVARLVAIVPARGGSKGIPRKNMSLLAGRPLIDYTLHAAKLADVFDDIIVSTDDPETAEFSTNAGCSVHHRPHHLATDSSRVVDSVLDAAKSRQLDASTLIMVLQPTSPFRTEHHIREAAGLLHGQDSSAVVSVVECEHHPLKTVRIENQRIVPTNEHRFLEASRQDLPRIFRPNGALYLAPLSVTIQTGSLVPPHAHALEMSREDSLDIDSANDLMLAQLLLHSRPTKHIL